MRRTRYSLSLLTALLFASSGSAQPATDGCTPAAVDHVPIALVSLDRARLSYEQLGFRLKPGRVHANGLRNAFAKFPAGDYLELISPERGALDDLSERYVNRLLAGEGGAALALRVDSLAAFAGRLETAGIPVVLERYGSAFATLAFADAGLHWLFLIEYLRPVIDPPELLSHPNTAIGIETVWLTAGAYATLPAIADHLCLPAVRRAPEGAGEAPVAGVTLRVSSIDAARQTLRAAGVEVAIRRDARGRSVLAPATRAHGIFIEFLEPDPSPTPQPAAGP